MTRQMLRIPTVALFVLGAAAVTRAQVPTPLPSPGGDAVVIYHGPGGPASPQEDAVFVTAGPGGPVDGVFAFEGFVGDFGGKVVTGAPFAAEVTTEHVQKLADGNSIDNKTSGMIARDSAGRTRREMSLPAIGPLAAAGQPPQMAFINDPVAQAHFVLNLTEKTAHKMPVPARGDFGPESREVLRPLGGVSEAQTESLGQKSLEGLAVQGTRVTRTIPAGAMGNTNPIVITTERWYSPDLQTTVLETRSDPRFGTTTFQLTNINRNEPDPSLFTVPADFTLQQGKGFFHIERGAGRLPPPPPQD